MDKNKKFRNHISIVAEEIWSGILVLIAFVFVQILPELAEASAEDISFWAGRASWILLGLLALLLLLVGTRILVWFRTTIHIEDNAIVIEKNTLNKKKNTIGIRNISNINLEQNLLEMIFGTCKVKMDTNSLSTADQTDVKIVLKKTDAEQFRREIMSRMQASGMMSARTESAGTESAGRDAGAKEREDSGYQETFTEEFSLEEDYDVRADMGDIIAHGFFSINVFSVLLLLAGIAAAVGAVVQAVQNPGFVKSLLGMAAGILVTASVVLSALWDTIKDFVKYYDFRAKRRGDRLYIRYGLLKKMEYTVPVDKIQALEINQSLVARISGRYMAEIVNVGMGDEKEEKNSFLVLYCKEEKLKQQLDMLLPELSGTAEIEIQRQPGFVWAVWAVKFALYALAVLLAAGVGAVMTDGMESSDRNWALAGIWGGAALLIVFALIGAVLRFCTDGVKSGSDTLSLCRGYFGRHYTVVKYSNIQYAELSQNFIAKRCGIQKGEIHLLAAAGKSSKDIPYFRDGLEEKIKSAMLKR